MRVKQVVGALLVAAAVSVFGEELLGTGTFRIRDPFVLPDNGTYYLYEAKPWNGGRGVNVFTSKDLKSWTPKVPVMELPASNACTAVWAPEVHKYKGKYWLFTTLTFPADPAHPLKRMEVDGFKAPHDPQPRGVWVFRSESPMGPFKPVKEGSVTPPEWMCLDGTLWVEDGKPWMVFCHEWVQTGNGRMMAAPLSDDLSRFTAEPVELFKATDLPNGGVVTDGPFLYRSNKGGLRMIWSNTMKGKGYCSVQCRSASGKVTGPWIMHTPLYARDGGHGMIFRTFEGQLMLTLHQPNTIPNERMRLYPLHETWEGFARADWDPFGREWQAQWTPEVEAAIDARIEKCRKADAAIEGLPPGAEVKVEQVSSQFLVGCNMFNFDQLGSDAMNAEYRAAFTNLFNAGTLAFYWKNVEPEMGRFRFASGPRDLPAFWNGFDFAKDDPYRLVEWRRPAPDRVIDFCKANGVAMHGHALIYVAWSPDWLWDVATTPEAARHWYDRHIYDMALRYGDVIPQWDVVNESLNRESTRENPDDAKNWFAARRPGMALPPDYTRRAFELSERLFPPNVRLSLNDAWTIRNDAYAAFAQKLIRDGAKVDVVGYQKHIFNPRDLLAVVSGFPCLTNGQTWDVSDETNRLAEIDARTGRPIHISEVTIPSPRGLAGLADAQADAIQARATRAFYRLWFSWPSVERITYWNLVDGLGAKNERMSSGWYNRDMTKKAVWHEMDRLFNHEWRTRLTARADAAGHLSFRGFKGRYRLTWRAADGTETAQELTLPLPGGRADLAPASRPAPGPLMRFWRDNDGKTVRRLPVDILPENVFWGFSTRDFADGMKTFGRLVDEGFARSTYNCVTLTLRCNPELGDPETQAAAKAFFAKARAAGVKVYMDTDPRIARREFFSRWPGERQSLAAIVTCAATNGAAVATHAFKDVQDHMSWGSKSAYRPLNGRIAAALAVKRGADGALDFATARRVETLPDVSVREWREAPQGGYGVDRSAVTVTARASGLAADETLVVTALAEYYSIDVFSPHLIPFVRGLMARYKALGADGGMRDEWGFIPNYDPNQRTFWWSPHFAAAYRAVCGRDLLDDFPVMACGPKGDARRAAAIGTFMRLNLARNAEIERDFYETDKRLFGADTYVCKHPTWYAAICPQEYFHNGLDWWQARRDWAQTDEDVPFYAANGMAKKWGGPVWLNEGYTTTPERNVYRVWTYATCGGRQVYHGLYGDSKAMRKYNEMPWEEGRIRRSLDLLAPGNVTAQARVRLPNLITRAQVDCPVAFVFGHERLVDWSGDGWNDHGQGTLVRMHEQGWWCDAYPASEFALGTFAVDADGWLRVGQQRYRAIMLHNLSAREKASFDALVAGHALKTRLFGAGEVEAVCAYLEQTGAVRQPLVKRKTKAGFIYPEPDGTLRLIDGTAIRVRADWEHPFGLPIAEEIASNGAKVSVAAEGLCAVRVEKGRVTALAAGGLTRVEGPGLSLALERPEDVVLLMIDGEWHGIWQTPDAQSPLPAPLAALTKRWICLLVPAFLATAR